MGRGSFFEIAEKGGLDTQKPLRDQPLSAIPSSFTAVRGLSSVVHGRMSTVDGR
jgi:hypothetical protein